MRQRVYAAIIRQGQILMVEHTESGRTYWTLPGGGIEAGETPEQAVLREVWEETGLMGLNARFLFLDSEGREQCFLVEVDQSAQAILGYDPELPPDAQMIQGLAWFDLKAVAEDKQVRLVLQHL